MINIRKTSNELNDMRIKYGIKQFYSWSRINSWHNSHYEYFLTYVKKPKEVGLRNDSCYVYLGGLVHEVLESYYNGEIEFDEMSNRFNSMWLTIIELSGLKFNRSDSEMNHNIGNKYKFDLVDFFKNHNTLEAKHVIEMFIPIKIDDDTYLQGYADIVCYNDDGTITIGDWKTSSIYKGAKKENELGQLVMYALGLNQMGIPLDKIKVAWNFLKYVKVSYMQKNGKIKERDVERYGLGSSLAATAKSFMKDEGYSIEEIDEYLKDFEMTDDIKSLPEEVASRYTITDCWVYTQMTQELIDKWVDYVKETVKTVTALEEEYNVSHDDTLFYDDADSVAKQSYYYANLSQFSVDQLPCYKAYLQSIEDSKNGLSSMFGMTGTASSTTASITNTKATDTKENDLAWLDDLFK